jgi:hypothetical protein
MHTFQATLFAALYVLVLGCRYFMGHLPIPQITVFANVSRQAYSTKFDFINEFNKKYSKQNHKINLGRIRVTQEYTHIYIFYLNLSIFYTHGKTTLFSFYYWLKLKTCTDYRTGWHPDWIEIWISMKDRVLYKKVHCQYVKVCLGK